MTPNQHPEQIARDQIDALLTRCGWVVQDKKRINLFAGPGVAVREMQTSVGPADYILFVDQQPVGVIEAKREDEGYRLSVHEDQAGAYAGAKVRHLDNQPLSFVYVSTGQLTHFTDLRDPKPRAREVFAFHRPETFAAWLRKPESLRKSFQHLRPLRTEGLRQCQITAITHLEQSFRNNKPRALVQMATGSGKTYTAITAIYRLLRDTHVRRVLFLVDTKNLGEQAEQEFMAYVPNDDNRTFTELYNVCRLRSPHVPDGNHVYISTIQRLYAVLKGEDLDEAAETENPHEHSWRAREIPPVAYNAAIPVDFFDCIVIDECHRSIYNVWRQVLDYFDAFQVGLTATPDNRTYGYFNQNLVSEYSHESAVADGVNVSYEVFLIDTKITAEGATLTAGSHIEVRERLSRKKRLQLQDEDEAYDGKQLDNDVVNPSQIRTIVRTLREHLPAMFPDRYDEKGVFEVPKTLIFAKSDHHADDIIRMVREEFDEENSFCKKITYRSAEDPKSVLADFRNRYHPRIAVTVDMIATGTDIKPLECLVFMRDVKSRNYFEQMKGRGTRVLDFDDLRKVSPTAKITKDHFVIVDAIGVTRSRKAETRSLERTPGVSFKELLGAISGGARGEDLFTTLAGRMARLDRQLTPKERDQFTALTGKTIPEVAKALLRAYDPDAEEDIRTQVATDLRGQAPAGIEAAVQQQLQQWQREAARVFTGEVCEFLEQVRLVHEQKVDIQNIDEVTRAIWAEENAGKARETVAGFAQWVAENRDEITALQLYYGEPWRRRELTYAMVKELSEALLAAHPNMAPLRVWRAYEQLEAVAGRPLQELTALVALVRRVLNIDPQLTPYADTVNKNFQAWVFRKQAGSLKFTEEQMTWLRMIRDHVATSVQITREDLEYTPFDGKGGLSRMWQLFGNDLDSLMTELNEALAA